MLCIFKRCARLFLFFQNFQPVLFMMYAVCGDADLRLGCIVGGV